MYAEYQPLIYIDLNRILPLNRLKEKILTAHCSYKKLHLVMIRESITLTMIYLFNDNHKNPLTRLIILIGQQLGRKQIVRAKEETYHC